MYWDQQYIVAGHSILAFLYVQCSGEFTLNTMISPAAFALYSSLLQSNSVRCNAFQRISTLQCIAVSEAGDWWGLGWITIKIVTATVAQSYYHRHRHHALKGQTLDDLVETITKEIPSNCLGSFSFLSTFIQRIQIPCSWGHFDMRFSSARILFRSYGHLKIISTDEALFCWKSFSKSNPFRL